MHIQAFAYGYAEFSISSILGEQRIEQTSSVNIVYIVLLLNSTL